MSKDKFGIVLSMGCIIHCVLTPLVLPLLPLIGLTFKHEFLFHIVIATIIGFVAYGAFESGYKKHWDPSPKVIGYGGVAQLFLGSILEMMSLGGPAFVTTLIGSLFLIIGHYFNHKYSCSCEHHD